MSRTSRHWPLIGLNLGQYIGKLLMEIDNEHEAKFLKYKPRKEESYQRRLIDALEAHGGKVTWPDLRVLCECPPEQYPNMVHALLDLWKHGHVSRDGTRRKYRYWITRRA
uniref:Uncharacterized protein n=1 Tax=viral metagenome TaxID=1070528 RepID=A0A6M3IX33_9ZZZZ